MDVQIQGVLNINHGGITAAVSVTTELDLAVSGKKAVLTQTLSNVLADIELGGDIDWNDGTWLMLTNRSSTVGETITIAKSAIEIGIIEPGETYGPIKIVADGTPMRAKSAAGTPTMQVVVAGPLA